MMLTDPSGAIVAVNRQFTELTGFSREDVLGRRPSILRSDRHDEAFYASLWRSLLSERRWTGDVWNRRKNGQIYLQSLSISGIAADGDTVSHYLGVMRDVTSIREDQARIYELAHRDTLTGLPNRTLFMDRLQATCLQTQRTGALAALLFIDLDRFKWINDTLGHDAGDELLRETARRLTASVRSSDTVVRLGGDEFTIILNNIATAQDAGITANNILAGLADPYTLTGEAVYISGSIGITVIPIDGSDVSTLMKKADLAMYDAKDCGRNTVRFFTDDLNAQIQARVRLERELRTAIENDEFSVHFQPIMEVSSGKVAGAEALLRWRHPARGIVGPGEFISVAEQSGLLVPIGRTVLTKAVDSLACWRDAGFPHVRVSVNLSKRQLRDATAFAETFNRMQSLGLSPKALEFEISESLLRDENQSIQQSLSAISRFGVGLAIDDFGTGYTSFRLLRQFSIQSLRIDRIFVRKVQSCEEEEMLMSAMIAMAHSMKIPIVGEGVESPEQMRFLAARGCDYVQGYYLARPLDEVEFLNFLHKQGAN